MIEFEKVQLIRKRAKTKLAYCQSCNAEADLIGLSLAAKLFEISITDLTEFVVNYHVHCVGEEFDAKICVPSLLAKMQHRYGNSQNLIDNMVSDKDDKPETVRLGE